MNRCHIIITNGDDNDNDDEDAFISSQQSQLVFTSRTEQAVEGRPPTNRKQTHVFAPVTLTCDRDVHLLESIPSTSLNESLRNFNTWRVSVGNRTLLRDFWISSPPQKKWGTKTTCSRRLRDSMTILRANISGKEHDRDNWETALETTLSQNFTNFGLLTAKIDGSFHPTSEIIVCLAAAAIALACRSAWQHFLLNFYNRLKATDGLCREKTNTYSQNSLTGDVKLARPQPTSMDSLQTW